MKKIIVFTSVLVFTSCFLGEELPPDQQTWEYSTPTDVGLSDADFFSINRAISSREYDLIGGLIIIKDDQLIFENYFSDTLDRQSLLPIGESSITFTIAAIGVAEDLGLLELNDPIQQYLPEYTQPFLEDVRKQNITIAYLMTNVSGFSWNETVTAKYVFDQFGRLIPNPENNLNQMTASADWIEFVLNQPLETEPGLRYNLNSGMGIILSKIVENAAGQSFDTFLTENLLEPIDATNISISQDPSGNFDGGLGISVSLLDWTKLAYLLSQNGIKDGRRIINPNFIEESTSVQVPVSFRFNSGYGWLLFGSDFENAFPFDKDNAYYSEGEMGQNQYVVTEENMIVTIYAENFLTSQPFSFDLFRDITLLIP